MNLKQLETFAKIAENGSFSQTAKELFLTQPTVSTHIMSLENELGVKLFARTTKEVMLSADGEKLYEHAVEMLRIRDRILELFSEEDSQEKRISIAASTIPAQYIIPKLLPKFSELYPNIHFHLQEVNSAVVVEKVASHEIDVGFTGTEISEKFCKYIPIYKDELVIITPNTEKYRAYRMDGDRRGLDWLMQEAFILREQGSGTRREAERILRENQIDVASLKVVAQMESTEAIKRSVRNGMGITIISKLAARDEIEDGQVLAFSLPEGSSRRMLNVVYNNSYPLTDAAAKLLRLVSELKLD